MKAEEMRRVLNSAIMADWDDGRTYLGMSGIGQCSRKLYNDLVQGRRRPSDRGIRYCHEGYLHEQDVIERLNQEGVRVLEQGRELVAGFDERFRGHIDGEVDGDLLEIKSVEDYEALDNIRSRGARTRDRAQVQAYMRYGEYERALIVYKVRSNGDLWVVWVMRDEAEGERLETKALGILEAVDRMEPPVCECGRCKG